MKEKNYRDQVRNYIKNVTCVDVVSDIKDIDNYESPFMKILTKNVIDKNDDESVKCMSYVVKMLKNNYPKGFLFYVESKNIVKDDNLFEAVKSLHITEFGVKSVIYGDKILDISPKDGYFIIDIPSKFLENLNVYPQIYLYFDNKPI